MTLCQAQSNCRLPLLMRHRSSGGAHRWVLPPTLALLALLVGLPAQAANYLFPSNLPAGCSVGSNAGTYNCGALTLAANDTIGVNSATPITVSFTGAFTTGANNFINSTGVSSNLSLVLGGAFVLGANSTLNANVIASAAVDIDIHSVIGGYIRTTLTTGVVTIADYGTVSGPITTTAGAITLGDHSMAGPITSPTGVIAIGSGSTVGGAINVGAGAVTIGAGSTVAGAIATDAGVVTIGAGDTIGDIFTAAGGITIGDGSTVGAINTSAGVITLGSNVRAGVRGAGLPPGDITSGAGAVTLGAGSGLCGSIIVTGAGVVTATTNIKIGGNISTTAGAITVGAGSRINGNIISTGAGVVTMTGAWVGGNISTGAGAISLTGSRVGGTVGASGAGVVTLTGTVKQDQTLNMPPACAALPAGGNSTVAASFDCIETGVNSPWVATARRPLYTKLAATSFRIDIAALKADGTLAEQYVAAGGAPKYVKVELFDDTIPAACAAYGNPVTAAQTVTFAAGSAGRMQSADFNLPGTYRLLRARVTECTDSGCGTPTAVAPACSSDQFSVRPSAATLTTAATASAPSTTSSPAIRAGAGFSLALRTDAASSYSGLLTLDTSKMSTQISSQADTTQGGGAAGTLTPSALTANAAAVNATFSEVGYLYLAAGAYRDDTFTAVDSASGDCITSTAGNLGNTLIGGKYGCSIGNQAAVSLGRFVPDHFNTAINPDVPMPCPTWLICPASGFVYANQPFGITVTARNAADAITLNYSGAFARAVTLEAWNAPGSIGLGNQNPPTPPGGNSLRNPLVQASAFAMGIGNVATAPTSPAYIFPTAAAPTDIYLRAFEAPGWDSVTSARGGASTEGGLKVLSSRFLVSNNYGSELLALPVNVTAQYWNGNRFINSTTDNVSSFASSDVKRNNCKKKLSLSTPTATLTTCIPSLDAAAPTPPLTYLVAKGAAVFKLAAPGAGKSGSVDIYIDSTNFPWLPSTTGRASFGIYKAGPVIFIRELY